MGSCQGFRCRECDVSGVVSGRPDRGFSIHTLTVYCVMCGHLQDIAVEFTWSIHMQEKPDSLDLTQVCRICSNPDLVEWKQGQPCPCCGGVIEATGRDLCLWD